MRTRSEARAVEEVQHNHLRPPRAGALPPAHDLHPFPRPSARRPPRSSWWPPSRSAGPSSRLARSDRQYRMAMAENERLRADDRDDAPAPRRHHASSSRTSRRGPAASRSWPDSRTRCGRAWAARARRPAEPEALASESALLSSRLTLLEEPVLPALGAHRLDAHRLAGPRRRQLRFRRALGPLQRPARLPRGRRHLDGPQRAGPRHRRRHRAAQRVGRRVRQGDRDRARRPLRDALRPPRGDARGRGPDRSTAATASASSARRAVRRRRICTTRCTSTAGRSIRSSTSWRAARPRPRPALSAPPFSRPQIRNRLRPLMLLAA